MRRTGKTTRLIDEAIQYFFINGTLFLPKKLLPISFFEKNGEYFGKIPFYDRDINDKNLAQSDFVKKTLSRLNYEHINDFKIKEDKNSFYIMRKDEIQVEDIFNDEKKTKVSEFIILIKSLIGSDVNTIADKVGDRKWRITKVDGEPRIITADVNLDRLNFEIENNKITKVYAG